MKPRILTAVAAVAATVLLLSGCTGGSDPDPSSTSAPSEGPHTLRVNWGGFPLSWAPGTNATQPGHFRIVYEFLLNRTRSGEIEPGLATDWEFGEQSRSLTLTLREGVLFQDGTPFDADAVAANIAYVSDVVGGQYGGPLAAAVESVEVVDDHTITINFTRPYPTFTTVLSGQTLPIGSPAAIEAGTIESHPVGTSPWAYDPARSTEGSTMFFGRFEDYWGEFPPFDNIELYAIPDDTAAVAAVLSGEIDVSDAEAEQTTLVDGSDTAEWYQYPALRNNVTFMARGSGDVLGDVRVRQALCYALDMPTYAQLDPTIHAATQHFTEGEPGYNPSIEGYPYNVERATQLLADAGNPTIQLTFPAAPFNRQQVEVYADYFNQLPGVTVTVQELPVPEYVATWTSGQYPLGIGSHVQLDPADWYGTWFADTARSNPSGEASAELQELVGVAQRTPAGPEQDDAWAAVMKQISDEALACGHAVVDQVIVYNTDLVTDVEPTEIAAWEVNLIDYYTIRPAN